MGGSQPEREIDEDIELTEPGLELAPITSVPMLPFPWPELGLSGAEEYSYLYIHFLFSKISHSGPYARDRQHSFF